MSLEESQAPASSSFQETKQGSDLRSSGPWVGPKGRGPATTRNKIPGVRFAMIKLWAAMRSHNKLSMCLLLKRGVCSAGAVQGPSRAACGRRGRDGNCPAAVRACSKGDWAGAVCHRQICRSPRGVLCCTHCSFSTPFNNSVNTGAPCCTLMQLLQLALHAGKC